MEAGDPGGGGVDSVVDVDKIKVALRVERVEHECGDTSRAGDVPLAVLVVAVAQRVVDDASAHSGSASGARVGPEVRGDPRSSSSTVAVSSVAPSPVPGSAAVAMMVELEAATAAVTAATAVTKAAVTIHD